MFNYDHTTVYKNLSDGYLTLVWSDPPTPSSKPGPAGPKWGAKG